MSVSDNMTFTMGTACEKGLQRFSGPPEARLLYETQLMKMPTMDPPAPDELMEWATASGQWSRSSSAAPRRVA